MNLAPTSDMTATALSSADLSSRFLARASVEITARQIDKVPLLAQKLAPGARVYVALIDPADAPGQIAAAAALHACGLEPVPHMPARFILDRDDLARRLDAFAKRAEVKRMLVLGGGAAYVLGRFDSSLQLLETGLFQAHGIENIGLAGHPEGNSDITKLHGEAALIGALKLKQAYLKDHGLRGHIATQFLFEAAPVAEWAQGLRSSGIELPIHVGVPGPATIKTLVKYAAVCGVGNSARFIKKQAFNVTKLLTVAAPDDFVADLARLHLAQPALGLAAPHIYPFGGFDRLFEWLAGKA